MIHGDITMTHNNIVIFSSGVSEQSGITANIKSELAKKGYNYVDWRGLFSSANDSNSIALLPMLIKKIPTFDFAVLVCEGHDITYISRGENSETVKSMRDNVLFEIGLCAMAIGLNRTILVTDSDVRLPDDLTGINGNLAVKQIKFPELSSSQEKKLLYATEICESIDSYISSEKEHLTQIVIGAAASGACGYVSNFICRILEHIDDGICISDGKTQRTVHVSPEQVYMHIVLPNNLDSTVICEIKNKQKALLCGTILTTRSRPVEFHCYFEGDILHIVDYPTNVVTSYDTARIILEMDADDSYDTTATKRFVSKEMSLYAATLKSLLKENFIRQVIDEHYSDLNEEERVKMCKKILHIVTNNLTVSSYN